MDVLPAPLGPMMANSSPVMTSKLTSLIAVVPPNDSDIPDTSSTGPVLPVSRAATSTGIVNSTTASFAGTA